MPANTSENIYPDTYGLGSQVPVWWRCRVCGLQWSAPNRSRYGRGTNCPSRCFLLYQLPISDTHPIAATALVGLSPATVFADTPGQLEWRCPQGHLSVMSARGYTSRGCSECAAEPATLATTRWAIYLDPLAEGYSVSLNQRVSSKESVAWKCDRGHAFSRRISRYVNGVTSCPHCKGRTGGTVAESHPLLVSEWSAANEVAPTEVTTASWRWIEWICSTCGCTWSAAVANRTTKGSGCPNCWKRRGATSLLEQRLAQVVGELVREPLQLNTRVKCGTRWCFPDMSTSDYIAIEYDSYYWHQDRVERDLERVELLTAAGYHVISVRECPLPLLAADDIVYDSAGSTLEEIASLVAARIHQVRYGRQQLA